MIKKLAISASGAAVILILSILLLRTGKGENNISAVLYYLNNDCTTLVAENENVSYNDPTHIPLNIIIKLQSRRFGKTSPVSRNCTVNTVSFDSGERITVDLSKEFLGEDSRTNVLCVYAIVKSICSTSQSIGIKEVKITVDGAPVLSPDGQRLGYLSDSSISIMNSQESITYNCALYYVDKKTGVLTPEMTEIDAGNGTIEYNAVTAMINPPATRSLKSVFPTGTELISAQTWEGVCYVNFKPLPSSTDLQTIKNALSYTLVALDNIERVEIFIEGKPI